MGNLIDKISGGPDKRNDGVFYASVGQLWQGNEEEFNKFDLAALRRPSLHVFYHKFAGVIELSVSTKCNVGKSRRTPNSSVVDYTWLDFDYTWLDKTTLANYFWCEVLWYIGCGLFLE